MKLYVIVSAITALLYPLSAAFFWSTDLSRAFFYSWEGVFICVALGAVSSYVLWWMQKLSVHIPLGFRPMFIRFGGAELVGTFSVILLMVLFKLTIGEEVPLSFGAFLTLQMPAFVSSFIAYHAAGLLVTSVVPKADTKKNKRR